MAWAIAKKKPFFVGGRSIELRLRQPMTRKLVGFAVADSGGPDLAESNLVLRGNDIVGFVTSVVRSPTLNRVIGMAYAHPDDAEVGGTITIKADSGETVTAGVVALPFYDPDNARQEM